MCCDITGPVLEESLFFPELSGQDNSTIFLHWGLHSLSLPASHYSLTVEAVVGRDGETTNVLLEAQGTGVSFTRHQFTPVVFGVVYRISVMAVNEERGVSSPAMSFVWRVGEDICEFFGTI